MQNPEDARDFQVQERWEVARIIFAVSFEMNKLDDGIVCASNFDFNVTLKKCWNFSDAPTVVNIWIVVVTLSRSNGFAYAQALRDLPPLNANPQKMR